MTHDRAMLTAQRIQLLDTQATWLAILVRAAVEFDAALARGDSVAALGPRFDALEVAVHRFGACTPHVNRVDATLAPKGAP